MSVLSSRRPSLGVLVALAVAAALALACVVALGTPSTASAQATVHAQVYFKDSNGVGYEGVEILYWSSGSWRPFGVTDANGLATRDVATATQKLRVQFRRGAVESGPVDLSQPYTFNTVKVNFLNAGTLYYQGYYQGWGTYQTPTSPGLELLPFTYTFSNQQGLGNRFQVTIGPDGFTGGVLHLIDSNGNGLAGGTASYYIGGWYSLPGTTDANGNLVFTLPSNSPSLNMAMAYEGSREQKTRSQLDSSNFTFQTANVTVELKDADGNPLDTGQVSYYAGGWRTFGSGQTSGGSVSQEMLPTSVIAFGMSYNHSSQQKNGIVITAPATTVTFQTGRLDLHFSDPIVWYSGGYWTFANGMEFLPGTQTFFLGGSSSSCSVAIPFSSGDHLVKTGIVATLKTSSGAPLSDGVASAYAAGWKTVGMTGSNGRTCAALDGKYGNVSVSMNYAGTAQMITQHQPTNSFYAFTTSLVTVELRNSGGTLSDTGNASYYAGGWHSLGDTSGGVVTANMLPGNYSFAMSFNGTRQQLNAVAISGSATTVTFTTSLVTIELRDSHGDLFGAGSASYYASGWRSIGDTTDGVVTVEMLPGSYSFAMVYLGTRQQLNAQPVSAGASTVTFQTGSVQSTSGTATSYYAGGWRSFTNGMELLPGTYTFHFSDGTPNTTTTLQAGVENTIH